MNADDTASHFMSRHETNVFATVTAILFGGLMPAAIIDTTGKICIAFACGFASLAGQALWRMAVRRYYDLRKVR